MQASLAAALRDGGIIAELGKAKEERITNERNKSYPDKAVAAVHRSCALEQLGEHGTEPMALAQAAPKPTQQPTQQFAAGDGTAESNTGAAKPVTDGEEQLLQVGCIVDIPSSPNIPPMRIGAHSSCLQSIPSSAELCCAVMCGFGQRTLTANQRRLFYLVLRSRTPRTRMPFSHGTRGYGR